MRKEVNLHTPGATGLIRSQARANVIAWIPTTAAFDAIRPFKWRLISDGEDTNGKEDTYQRPI